MSLCRRMRRSAAAKIRFWRRAFLADSLTQLASQTLFVRMSLSIFEQRSCCSTIGWRRGRRRRAAGGQMPPAIAMDLQLLEQTLADRGEPSFRARQVWSWAARGAGGFEEMTDLPAALRSALARDLPFSSLTLQRESRSRDGVPSVHCTGGRLTLSMLSAAIPALLADYEPTRSCSSTDPAMLRSETW